MDKSNDEGRIPISMMQNAIFASLQGSLLPDLMQNLREDLLCRALQHRCTRALLDLSGVISMDESEFQNIVETSKMLKLMGVDTTLVGMRPGVIAGLALLGIDLTVLPGVCDLDQSLGG